MQRYKSTYTGPQMDVAFERALPGGEIDAALESKAEIEFLDNTDFTNPVAQAGIGGNHGSVAYALDRWKLISGTVSGSANGLTLNGTIRQIREYPIGFAVVPSIQMYSGTATITYDDSTKYCDIVSSGGVIKRPHLGLREITDWAKMRTEDFGAELRKCQRYALLSGAGIVEALPMCAGFAVLSTPVTLRTAPAIIGSPVVYSVAANVPLATATVQVESLMPNGIILAILGASELAYVYFPANSGVSADL